MTDRRAFIGMASGFFAAPLIASAQQPAKVPRIGVLGNTDGSAWDGFRRGLRELGYTEGRNLAIEWRWAEGRTDRFPELAVELVQKNVDLIVTSSTPATRAAKQATGSVPIVMLNSAHPEKIGLVESLARPGGNVTGFSNVAPELAGKRFELLKEIAPKVGRVALLWNPTNPIEAIAFREVQAAAAVFGIQIQSTEVRTPDEHSAAFAAITAGRADALYAFGNPVNFKNAQPIADFALKSRLASIFDERGFVDSGGLFSYGSSYSDTYRRGATVVDKILKGAKPADLPIQQPTTFELVINAKTAQALGLTIPNSLLLRADQVIQ